MVGRRSANCGNARGIGPSREDGGAILNLSESIFAGDVFVNSFKVKQLVPNHYQRPLPHQSSFTVCRVPQGVLLKNGLCQFQLDTIARRGGET